MRMPDANYALTAGHSDFVIRSDDKRIELRTVRHRSHTRKAISNPYVAIRTSIII